MDTRLSGIVCIKDELTSDSILGFANPKVPYILHTGASTIGLVAALYQEHDGRMQVITYAGRGLSPSQTRHPAHKLQFLTLKWSIAEKFHDYLYGSKFQMVTDNNPFTYILTSAKLDVACYWWLVALYTFDFYLKYRAGNANQDGDGHMTNFLLTVSREEEEQTLHFLLSPSPGIEVRWSSCCVL